MTKQELEELLPILQQHKVFHFADNGVVIQMHIMPDQNDKPATPNVQDINTKPPIPMNMAMWTEGYHG
jgi:hypothetical protein